MTSDPTANGRNNGTGDAASAPAGNGPAATPPGRGLSAKLLIPTIGFVMISEVCVFVPSVSNFRQNWLMERLAAAQIAALAAEVTPDHELPAAVRDELLRNAQVRAVALKRGATRRLIVQEAMPPTVAGHYDLRKETMLDKITNALAVYVAPPGRYIRVTGQPGFGAGDFIEIVISEEPLKKAMIGFGLNILGLSIVISMITATLVYLALNAMLVRPMTQLTNDMVRFTQDPENPRNIIVPSERSDEIGTAERQLAHMQKQLAGTLQQQSHLAALGLAVSKINHDLRNMLANAQLISDRLGGVQDPTVQRFAPKLIASLDRAIRLCTETLRYGRAREAPPERVALALKPLAEEVGENLGLGAPGGPVAWEVDIAPDLSVDADPDQMFRILSNLVRNACQALEAQTAAGVEKEIALRAWREGAIACIEVSDTGPGVPEQARAHLFEAFQGSARKGGTGLGLAIAAELVRAHGGTIELVEGEAGATFRIAIPDRVVELHSQRQSA
ncbi:MAG: sensor histidine kinase [Methyloligellaceae bacterium]